MRDPKTNTFDRSSKAGCVITTASVLAIIGLVATGLAVKSTVESSSPTSLYYAIAGWAILPPFWFWYEYFRLYRKFGEPDTMELFKYGQQVAAAMWAGVLAALIAFAAIEPWKNADDVVHKSNAAVGELKANVLIEIRDSEGLTADALAQNIGIQKSIVDAILATMANDGTIQVDKSDRTWTVK